MVLNLRKERAIRASSRRMLNQDTPSPSCAATRTATVTPTSSSSSVIKKKTKKSRGKARNKTRKPKNLSLRLQLFSTDQKPQDQSTEMPTRDDHLQPQLNLFPSHPQTCLVQDKDVHDENMASLFSSADGGATTLAGLLGAATTASSTSSDEDLKKTHSTTTTLSPSASLTYAYRRQDSEEEVALVRTAIRNKEREPSEERWVRYSEVVERRDDQEVSSCCAAADLRSWRNRRLSLKLDYKEILNAWSDKGPLYIHDAAADSPQTVPDDIHRDFLASQLSNESSDVWGSNGGCVWRVPEMIMSKANEQGLRHIEVKTEEQQEQVEMVAEELKLGKREASVQRYKEKRQNRLFSKRIRYQVRKLNAEKRPRLKGRFVKRS